MDEDYTYTTPDPFNQVYAYISIDVIFVVEMKIKKKNRIIQENKCSARRLVTSSVIYFVVVYNYY